MGKAKATASPVLEKRYRAPKIQGPAVEGQEETQVDAHAFQGRWVVLYFYPKDMTPGCTVQAGAFAAAKQAFARQGAVIVGVSRDSCARHAKFAEKEGLNFLLLSDAEGALCQNWGVWKEKSLYGKKFMGIERSTFLIDPAGDVAAEWRGVKVTGHVDEVLATLKALRRD